MINLNEKTFSAESTRLYVTKNKMSAYSDMRICLIKDGCAVWNIDGTVYNTYIYCYDGYMMEIFAEEDVEISPVDGEKIMPLNKLSFNLDQGMLSIDLLSADDISQSLKIHIRSTKEAEL